MNPLYLIEHFDPTDTDRCGWFTCDREVTRRNVVEDIADGQMECVVKVLEIEAASPGCDNGNWFDVTLTIAEDVAAHLDSIGAAPSYEVLTFLQANGLRQYASAAE